MPDDCPWPTPGDLAREVDRSPDLLGAIAKALSDAMSESTKKEGPESSPLSSVSRPE
jgi:hypothetical protein